MRTSCWIALLVVSSTSFAFGQSKPPVAAPTATAVRSPQFPGYEIRQLEGFTLIVSDETAQHLNDAAYERKPLEVLELELKTIATLMRPEAVAILRKLLIFVEWDKVIANPNGRAGGMAAFYAPGGQQQMISEGMHPLQSKNITVCMMKSITESRQPKYGTRGCILLHEMTHAVHDRFFGYDHAPIKAAYRQAMERKLYDLNSYLTSNEKEFFACLTESYFDQGGEFPRTRNELSKHDPFTLALMETVWGKRDVPASTEPTSSPAPDVKLTDVDLGSPVLGDLPTSELLNGRPVFVLAWNASDDSSLSSLLKLNTWHKQLSEFGLATVGVHLTGNGQTASVKMTAESRGVSFPVTERNWRANDIVKQSSDFPQCYVFDHAGKCTFYGSPFEAETSLRRAVTEYLLADVGAEPLPKSVAAIAAQLRGGKSPTDVLALVGTATRATDAPTQEAAKRLLAKITAGAEKRLAEAERLSTSDPVEAFVQAVSLPQTYRGTTVASRATLLLNKIKRDKAVLIEFQAQPALMQVNKLDTELGVRPGSFDPTLVQFRTENAALLQQLQQTAALMKRTWPTSRSTAEALRIAERYAVLVP